MNKTNRENSYAIIAACCFGLYGLYRMVREYEWATSILNEVPIWEYAIWWIVFISMAVLVLVKKKAFLLIPVGVAVLKLLYSSLSDTIMTMMCFVVLFIIILINSFSVFERYSKITKYIWFIPVIFVMIPLLQQWVYFEYLSYLSDTWLYVFRDIIEVSGFIFTGLWLRESNDFNKYKEKYIISDKSTVGGAEKIKTYKKLLDSGVISQEEFDEVKKQVLGL